MGFEITRREVLNNLIRFKDSLLDKQPLYEHGIQPGKERAYKALLNRKTGDMRFPKKIKSLEYHLSRKREKGETLNDWKEIRIIVSPEGYFDVRNAQNNKLEPVEMNPLAWRVVRETLEVLNEKAKTIKVTQGLLEEEVLRDLSNIHLSVAIDRIEDLPAWMGKLDRVGAEKKLEGKVQGTYLIRDGDPITQAMGFHFAEENHLFVHPFLITTVENEDKISDYLVIQTSKGWTMYQDDPNLNDPILYKYESNPQALLSALIEIAKEPISKEV